MSRQRTIGEVNCRPYGNAVLLWFELDDFDLAVAHAEVVKPVKPR